MVPQSYELIDKGIVIASVADLYNEEADKFASSQQLISFFKGGIDSSLLQNFAKHKSIRLLNKMSWLTDELVVQESVQGGEYIAELMEQDVYDSSTHALRSYEAGPPGVQRMVWNAFKASPLLASNVVMLAMRMR